MKTTVTEMKTTFSRFISRLNTPEKGISAEENYGTISNGPTYT